MAEETLVSIATEQERRRAEIRQIQENSARLAYAYAAYYTSGTGRFLFEAKVEFDVEFARRPILSYGYSYQCDGQDPEDIVIFPEATGFVYDWVDNANGHFTGAYVGVIVNVAAVTDPKPAYVIEHNFTFHGIAMKKVPSWLLVD